MKRSPTIPRAGKEVVLEAGNAIIEAARQGRVSYQMANNIRLDVFKKRLEAAKAAPDPPADSEPRRRSRWAMREGDCLRRPRRCRTIERIGMIEALVIFLERRSEHLSCPSCKHSCVVGVKTINERSRLAGVSALF